MRRVDVPFWWQRFARLLAGAAGTLVSALTGVIRNKWLAHHLDTNGIGVLSQVVSGQNWLGFASGLGLSLPVARAVGAASADGADAEAGRRAAWSAAVLAAAAGTIAAVAGLLMAPAISRALLGTEAHASMVRLSMIGVIGVALWAPASGFFAGRSDVRAPLTFALAGGGGATVAAFLLVPKFGLLGAVTAVTLIYPLGVFGMIAAHAPAHRTAIWPLPRPLLATAMREAAPLLAVAGAALALSLIDLGAMLALRAHYLRENGVEANGLLQAALALAQQVGAIFYAYLGGYAFGKINAIAASEGPAGVTAYTRRQWTPLLLLAFGAISISVVAASPMLRLLYSDRFDAARPLMALTLGGEMGRVAVQALGLGALAVGGTRLWFLIGVTQPVALAIAYAWISRGGAGTESLPLAYAAASWVNVLVALALLGRRGVTLHARGLALLVAAFAALALLVRAVVG
ncbi:MAG TPA: hypothetical protein VFU59_04155 [Candidatus Eisenbacteria bacterium]|nr:hypothetical protein [Candidatus Eisenbacteria bacterium]